MTWSPDDAHDFLERFAHIPDHMELQLIGSDEFNDWPTNQTYYLNLASQLFPGPIEDWELRQRLVSIFRAFLGHDGRTFDALMYIADVASQNPVEYNSNGTNALAGIYTYLRWNRDATIPCPTSLKAFDRFATVTEIAHNANNIRSLIAKRGWDSDDDL